MGKYLSFVLAAISLPAALFSQNATTNSQDTTRQAFVGTWKLNVAQSKFDPGPGPKSETVTISEQQTQVQEVGPDGKDISWSFTPSGDSAVPIQGMDGSTVVEKRIDGRHTEHTWKMTNFKGTGHAVLSKDGKTVTYRMTGTNDDGKPVHNLMIFEKQ